MKEEENPHSISIHQPKIRIKIPKLLAKAIQRRNTNDTDGTNDKKKKKKWAKYGNLFPKKVNSIVQNVFGNKNVEGGKANQTDKKHAKPFPFSGIFRKRNRETNKAFNCSSTSTSSSSNLTRVSSGKVQRSRGEKGNAEREERREEELCKKRILMGEKCRPLNLSGALHYDQHGVLLSEELHQEE